MVLDDLRNHWFLRGAQSAFFYYVSCAPCANHRFQQRRMKEKARVDKAAKKAFALRQKGAAADEDLQNEDHDLLAGMGAFTTNIHWQEEIDAGPNFKRGMRPRQDIERDTRENKQRKERGEKAKHRSAGGQDHANTARRSDAAAISIDTVRTEQGGLDDRSSRQPLTASSGNQPQRYQRADEPLWGTPFPEKDWSYYARGRNPPINDYAPPVISSLPATAKEMSWALQPPPPAKIMEGKQMPITRSTSIGAASKKSIVSRISKRSGGTRLSELKRPQKALVVELSENMCSMSLTRPASRKSLRQRLHIDGATDSSRPTTPERGHYRQDSAFSTFSTFESPSRNLTRGSRPAPIQTALDSDTDGFDPHFSFPRRAGKALDSPAEPMSTVSSTMDGLFYHSEPEPELRYSNGLSFQDFAQRTTRPPTTADSEAPYQTPKSKATTRAGSNSPSPTTLSPDSSSSSLNVLKDVLVPATNSGEDKPVGATTFDAKSALPHMEGISEEDLEVLPRYSSGPREFRLGSGTQV